MSEQLLTFKIKKHKPFVLRQKAVLETLQEFRLRPELYIRALAKNGTLWHHHTKSVAEEHRLV